MYIEFKAISYEFEAMYKKILVITIILGLIAYFLMFYSFFDYLDSDGPIENMYIGIALFIPFTPFLVESMVRYGLIRTVGKEKWVIMSVDGIDLKNKVKGIRSEEHYNWSQIAIIEITDKTAILGKFSNNKFQRLRIVFDAEKYSELCDHYVRQILEQHHRVELASCCFDMEYTQAIMEEIKQHCNPEIVNRKRY